MNSGLTTIGVILMVVGIVFWPLFILGVIILVIGITSEPRYEVYDHHHHGTPHHHHHQVYHGSNYTEAGMPPPKQAYGTV